MILKKLMDTHTEKKAMASYGKYYMENRKKIYHTIKTFQKEAEGNIAIWGAGPKGMAFLRVIDPKNKYINTVIDIDESKQGKRLLTGHVIEGISSIVDNNVGMILVMNSKFYVDIEERIQKKGFYVRIISVDGFIQETDNIDNSIKEISKEGTTRKLLYRGAGSVCGYQSKILNRLKKENVFDKCVIVSQSIDNTDFYNPAFYTEIPAHYGYNCEYEKYIDSNKLYPLTEQLLQSMLPYESTAIKMVMRYTNFNIHNYEESKQEYLRHLQFWHHIILTEKIDAIFLCCLPHTPWEYVIYCIGKIRKIPILVLEPTHFSGRYAYGETVETIGYNTALKYKELHEKNEINIILNKQMQDFYDKHREDRRAKISYKTTRKLRDMMSKETERYIRPSAIIQRKLYLLKSIRRYKREGNKRLLQFERKRFYYDNIMTLKALFRYMTIYKQSDYNRIAQYPDYAKPYVYFALQLEPEASTLPKSGVFAEQIISIKLLAKSLEKYKIYIYVKEHVVQKHREKSFYEELLKIRNVKLIKTTVNTYDLINSSIAVSTQTGTCIWEGILRNKPALVFADGCYWKGAPGVFRIRDVRTCRKAMEKILNGELNINDDNLKRYLMAVEQTTIKTFLEPNEYGEASPSNDESIENVVDLISNWSFK